MLKYFIIFNYFYDLLFLMFIFFYYYVLYLLNVLHLLFIYTQIYFLLNRTESISLYLILQSHAN